MKLWTQRFLGSSRVQELSGDDRWRYLGLLVHEWARDSKGLPNDLLVLARLLGVDPMDFQSSWNGRNGQLGISQFFALKDGALFNDTLEYVLELERELHRKRSVSGKLGARRRWKKKKGDGKATDLPEANACPPPQGGYPKKDSHPSGRSAPLGASPPPEGVPAATVEDIRQELVHFEKLRKRGT